MESEQVFSTPSRDNLETAVLIGDWETAVDQCIEANDFGLAFLLATAGGPALYKKAQAAYLKRDGETEFQLLLLIASRRWSDIVKGIPLDQWHKALAVINTYAQGAEEYRSLCEQLGSRLQHDNDGEFRMESIACYMCAGNVDSMIVVIEDMAEEAASAAVLPNVVEKACVLLRTIQLQTPLTAELMDTSIDLFTSKAQLLAANFDRLGGNVVSRKLIGFATNEPMLESDEVFTDLPASANSELQASRVSHESQQQQPSSAVPSQQEMGMPVQRAASASLEPAHGYRGSSESGLMRGASVSSIDVPSHVPRMSSLSEASMHTRTINSKTPTIPEAQEPAQQQPPPNIQSSIQAYQHPQGQSGAQSTPGWSDNTPQGYQNPTSNQASQHNMVAPVAAHDVAAAPSSRGSGPYGVPVPPLNTSVPSSTQQQPSFPNTQPLHNDTHQPQAHGYNYSNPSHTQNAATYNPNVAHSQPAAAYTQNATHSQPVHTGDNTKSWNDPPEVAASQVQKPVYAVPTTITNPLQPASDQTPQASTQYAAQTSTSNTSTTGTAPAPSEGSDFLPQMPDEYQPIVNMLNEKLQICLAQGKQSYKRRLLDAQKKLDPLYKKLAYRQVGDVKFTQMLYDLASSLQSKDYGKASRWQTKLMSIQAQNNDMADIGKSMIGIKAIIHVAKSLGV